MQKDVKAALDECNDARRFPENTTPAARHVQMIAEALARGEPVPQLTEDPEHVALSLLTLITTVYKLKDELQHYKETCVPREATRD